MSCRTPSSPTRTLFAQDAGPRTDRALVLIHGLASSHRSWSACAALLHASHRVIGIDLLGHGQSPGPPEGGYSIGDQARCVAATLDDLDARDVVVIGHSTGGAVATALAAARSDQVAALALLDSGPDVTAMIATPFDITAEQWSLLTEEQIRMMMSAAFSRPGYQPPPEVVEDVRALSYQAFCATLFASHEYLREGPLPDRLCEVAKPLLILFGAEDRRWSASSAENYRSVPGSTIRILPGLGHSPMLEDPAVTAAALLDFTATLTTPSA